jgi:sorting nexin-31
LYNLCYFKALQDIEQEWAKPTQAQREELEAFQQEGNQTKVSQVWHQEMSLGHELKKHNRGKPFL